MRITIVAIAFSLAVGYGQSLVAQGDERFDIVLAGGRVMDPESGLDAVRYVGIRGGIIAAISSQPLQGDRVIDVRGLVVAPGSSTSTPTVRTR